MIRRTAAERRNRLLAALAGLVYAGLVAAIVYTVVHFAVKFW